MYEEQFSKRLAELRTKKGVSARDMSLSIWQNPGYIREIECRTTFPTMASFFYIFEHLNVTPQDFFNFDEEPPNGLNFLVDQLRQFGNEQIRTLTAFVKTIVEKLFHAALAVALKNTAQHQVSSHRVDEARDAVLFYRRYSLCYRLNRTTKSRISRVSSAPLILKTR